MGKKKQAYERKLQDQLDAWKTQIGELRTQADDAVADLRATYASQISHLRSLQTNAAKELGKLRASGDEAWEDLVSGVDSAWGALSKAFTTAISRFHPPKARVAKRPRRTTTPRRGKPKRRA